MPGTLMFSGPLPPEGGHWCTVCTMMAKALAINSEKGQAGIRTAQEGTDGKVYWVKVEQAMPLQEAVAFGVYPPLQQILPAGAWLCWSHLMGVSFHEGRIQPADPSQMPAGGVPLLGRSGRG